jgi:acetylornithine aminotransferase
MEIHPLVEELGVYPYNELADARTARTAKGLSVIDFGIGVPRAPTPTFIREALAESVLEEDYSRYPLASGLPELREAIAEWAQRRYGVRLDPSIEVLPTLGSKEAIYHLAGLLLWAGGSRDLVAVTTPGYPVAGRSTRLAGGQLLELPLDPQSDWLPKTDAIDEATWRRLAVIWINSPNNPTGSAAPLAFYEELAEKCRRYGVVLASDEAYSEIYLGDDKPASVLELSDPTHVLAFNSLSKRSAMAGYRSGSVCGDPLLIGAMKTVRPSLGVTPQNFVQRASIAAWGDESHVEAMRERYALARQIMTAPLEAAGLTPVGGSASFFLWCKVEGDGDDQAAARRVLDAGVLVAPGRIFGPGGEGYVRVALVPPIDQCESAAAALLELGQ